ncbi:hypothetical protein [Stenotrophomonas oahuensis]|uniref:Porin n=1 Tax=Stenotrophomonas oahuensis TaxID=3003271 RepID=A0ABY9YSA4_9GAMM|nr:hypothetical protein [Stenotrophomonas sp. A5586]WNH53762.1 hypothetical protein PDM29_05635 [Stenotrophomonas sp. A5586]
MIRPLSLLLCLLAPGVALAQSAAGATGPQSATDLNLAVPQEPLQYLNDPTLRGDPPGTFYGDKSGRRVARGPAGNGIAEVTDDKLRVNGSFTTGIGYSENFGNTHFNAAELNLNKNYTNDEGKTRNMNLNIRVSEGKGPGFYGPYGYGDYGYGGGGYWGGPGPVGW